MNKKISFPIAIIIIVVCAVLVGGFVVWQYFGTQEKTFGTQEKTIQGIPKVLYYLDKNLYLANPDGSNLKLITTFPKGDVSLQISKDGNIVLYLDLAGGLGEDFYVRDAFVFNRSTSERKNLLSEFGRGASGFRLSPLGNMIVYENDGIWLFNLAEGTDQKLKDPLDYGQIMIQSWSDDESKVYFYTNFSRSEFNSPWFINDTLYSIDIVTKKEQIEVDYLKISCEEPFFITYEWDNIFLVGCGNNFSSTEEMIIKVYDSSQKIVTNIISGSPFSEITNYNLSPNGQELIYYDLIINSMTKLDIFSKIKTKLELGTEQNQGIDISPDGAYLVYIIRNDVQGKGVRGVYVYDLENDSVIVSLPGAHFVGWVEESQDKTTKD